MKKKDRFFVLDGEICVKEAGAYGKVESAEFYSEKDESLHTLIPVFIAGHVLLWDPDSKQRIPIVAIGKVPKSLRFAELPAPDGYIEVDLATAPYIIPQKQKRPPR